MTFSGGSLSPTGVMDVDEQSSKAELRQRKSRGGCKNETAEGETAKANDWKLGSDNCDTENDSNILGSPDSGVGVVEEQEEQEQQREKEEEARQEQQPEVSTPFEVTVRKAVKEDNEALKALIKETYTHEQLLKPSLKLELTSPRKFPKFAILGYISYVLTESILVS